MKATPLPNILSLGGYTIHSTRADTLAQELCQACETGTPRRVFFANTNFVVQCRHLETRLRDPQVRIFNDGIGMDLAAMLVHRRRFRSNLNGTDFIPYLCRYSARPLRFFLLGGRPGVALEAARRLTHGLGQQVVGTCDGYGEMAAAGDGLAARINATAPDVVLVAFGNPLQEEWILAHADAVDAPLMFGVGALLDFLSGHAQRAPTWMRGLHMEWMYRLLREPGRLLRRYSLDLLVFFRICLQNGRTA